MAETLIANYSVVSMLGLIAAVSTSVACWAARLPVYRSLRRSPRVWSGVLSVTVRAPRLVLLATANFVVALALVGVFDVSLGT